MRGSLGEERTLQVSVWSDDDERVSEFANAVRLLAQAAFGSDHQSVVFSGIGVKRLRTALDDLEWAEVCDEVQLQEDPHRAIEVALQHGVKA